MENSYLSSVIKQFQYYKMLGDQTFQQLTDADLFNKFGAENNSIGIIVNHLWGNMKSRWTNFLSEDGEKNWRQRDLEFEDVINSRAELQNKWEEGWNCLFNTLQELSDRDLNRVIYIRNMGHTVSEAINRQLAHYAYHIGQIVFIGKMAKGTEWISLSIPKGKSTAYNEKKFSQERHDEHYTDEFLGT